MSIFNKDQGLYASQGRLLDEYSESERLKMLADRDMLRDGATEWKDGALPPLDLEKIFSRSVEIAVSETGCFDSQTLHVKYPTPDPEVNAKLKSLITAFAQGTVSGSGLSSDTDHLVALDDMGLFESTDHKQKEFWELRNLIKSLKP